MATKRQMAVALEYDIEAGDVPRVTAKGAGCLADKILELAEVAGVPVQSEPDLVEVLASLDLGDSVPVEVYPLVAEVLAYIYKTNARYKKKLDAYRKRREEKRRNK